MRVPAHGQRLLVAGARLGPVDVGEGAAVARFPLPYFRGLIGAVWVIVWLAQGTVLVGFSAMITKSVMSATPGSYN